MGNTDSLLITIIIFVKYMVVQLMILVTPDVAFTRLTTDTMKITMDYKNGLVKYYQNGNLALSIHSTETASGTYYPLTALYQNGESTNCNWKQCHLYNSNIISATGLTDNTSTPQHYAITRDSSNLWTIYQNGVSEATDN